MTSYFIDGKRFYLLNNGESISEEIMKAWELETAKKDEEAGYRDRKAGYYDKWYRYNRSDDGAAYDRGCVRAANEGKCADDFKIIECLEAAI